MDHCICRGVAPDREDLLTLECRECAGRIVHCNRCGRPAWWLAVHRIRALNAAESHRWESGHARVLVRRGARIILREVLEDLAAA